MPVPSYAEIINHSDIPNVPPPDVEDVHGVPVHDEEASFNGVESDSEITCKHGKRPICRVASKGINTGRRFLACPNEKKDACRFVHWIDAEWEGNAERTIRYMWHKRTELSKELKRAEKEWNRVLSDNRVYEIEMNLNDKLRIREHDKLLCLLLCTCTSMAGEIGASNM
ncbi:hypothetical protein BRADI_1g56838v3 [Brachypodium distachyon]|uniref:GRF-type domain-containing protein n=1 Tax=Brachypodium distachyon TaxID=15368 RepID=A0A0Q3HDA3_BRADI|nr:hypothetical protein BRADI_1g56838v3 [Brachypodium distachyon]